MGTTHKLLKYKKAIVNLNMEPDASDGFSFSQELTSGWGQVLSQGLSQLSQNSQSSDCTWYSENSQSMSQPVGTIPQKRFDQMVPPSFPEVKKAKYNLPKWTKGLLKTAEENQKLKSHGILLKQQEEDSNYLKMFVQEVQKNIAGFPELVANMVKESTNFMVKNFEKRNDDLKMELVQQFNDTVEQKLSCLKQQLGDNTFETWNYLSEVKIKLDEIKTLLDDEKNESDIVMTKINQCCESILKVQQKVEEKSKADANQEKMPSFPKNEVENGEEILNGSDSDDVFQVSILRSRRRTKKKIIFQPPKPAFTSTPIPNYRQMSVRKLLDDDEMYQILSETDVEP